MVYLPDVAWISARDGSRAPGDLEDQAARYHPGRHELTINADFRAISDLIAHWRRRYQGVPGARPVIEAQVREWCEQVLVEVVLAARNSSWSDEQLDALLSPTSFSAALLPRHLLHATLQKRLAQKLGAPRTGRVGESARPRSGTVSSPQSSSRGSRRTPSWPGSSTARTSVFSAPTIGCGGGLHPDGMAAIYGEHPAAAIVAFAEHRSEVVGAPDPLQAAAADPLADPPGRTATTSMPRRIAANSRPKSTRWAAPSSTST